MKHIFLLRFFWMPLFIWAGCQPKPHAPLVPVRTTSDLDPTPTTRREDVHETLHNRVVEDPYRWLENRAAPETQAWMTLQHERTRKYLSGLRSHAPLQRRLTELLYLENLFSPIQRGARLFFGRRPKDKDKAIWFWQEGAQGTPKVLLDPNALSSRENISIRGVYPSRDGRWVAFTQSLNNADDASIFLQEVATGRRLTNEVILGGRYAEPWWTPDGSGFYYIRLPSDPSIPPPELPGKAAAFFHKLGTPPDQDSLVREATGNPSIFSNIELSEDGRFLISRWEYGWNRSDVWIRDHEKGNRFIPLVTGRDARFHVTAWEGALYVHTNDGAPNFRLFRVHPDRLERDKWTEIVPEQIDGVLRDVVLVGGRLLLHYMRKAHSELSLCQLDGSTPRPIEIPLLGTVSEIRGLPKVDRVFFRYESYIQPTTVYELSAASGKIQSLFQVEVPARSNDYRVEQVWYPSRDGTRVSMFVITPKDFQPAGSTPFLLNGYGGFGWNMSPDFRPFRYAWLEAGGGIAIPNLRGGGEYGETWHRAGMRDKKQNVFDDFIAAAEYLIREGYTRPDRLAIHGGSNGGLLVGAAMVQRPELFAAVSCHAPLLDMLRYHKFGAGPTWIEEYGSADDSTQFATLRTYSPYHHVHNGVLYPALFMASPDNDDRVDPMHARKFTAAVQAANPDSRPILFRLEQASGHTGGDKIDKLVQVTADNLAFLFEELRIDVPKPWEH